jgi:hypothetical protein
MNSPARLYFMVIKSFFAVLLLCSSPCFAAQPAAPLGASYPCYKGQLADAQARLGGMKTAGFGSVSFVPVYAYEGLNRVDFSQSPDEAELGTAVEAALRFGLAVVLKPHLDPKMYQPGFDSAKSDEDGWRIRTSWRGFFDVDPMCPDYRQKIIFAQLAMLRGVFARIESSGAPVKINPVRLELGVELMNSMVYSPRQWLKLLGATRKEVKRLGLEGKVKLSHNFCHHFEMPEDFVLRMTPKGRAALAEYIRGLDGISLSQYMDLTAAMPPAERGKRMPAPAEIAAALVKYDNDLRDNILGGLLGLKPQEIPPLYIGEFGVGTGGLRHPNIWDGTLSPDEEKELDHEIAQAYRGLLEYLRHDEGRRAQGAALWLTGAHYDVFGWQDPRNAIPEARDALVSGLAAR